MVQRVLAVLVTSLLTATCTLSASAAVALFESPHVHPLELSPDRSLLLAVNTDDHRLSVFDLTQGGPPILIAEIPVGLEPVSVRARTNTEAWVVNHLSDSISIVDLTAMNVVRTLAVGDEPTDAVFAGGNAWVCVSQEDLIRVYDAVAPASPVAEIPLTGSDPRSLAVGKNGDKIYVTVHDSGNKSTIVPEPVVASTLGLPAPNPPMAGGLPAAPDVSLIVQHNGTNWVDEIARSWDFVLPYQLRDEDLFEIDVVSAAVSRTFNGVGTSLFNVAVNPVSGDLLVTNQEADNEIRFEPNLKGRFARSRVTHVDVSSGAAAPVHLNPHINYADPAGNDTERGESLAMPLDLVMAEDGQRAYVAAFSSHKVGVVDAAGTVINRITVGGGPSGVALDTLRDLLYVLNRFDNTISSVELVFELETGTVGLGFDTTPADLRQGREVFYDAAGSSAHGDLSCATCHLFVGLDNIAWDLGDPTGSFAPAPPGQLGSSGFHPMKGPMNTQSLRGLAGTEPFHWRGDRENLAAFNGAFVSLLGRGSELDPATLALFEGFVNAVQYPPNPFRNLDGSLPDPVTGPNPANGEQLFLTGGLVGGGNCNACHALPTGENGLIIPSTVLLESQDMVVPQLRNMYEKTRFQTSGLSVRGFGYIHDGSSVNLFEFLSIPQFNFNNDDDKRDVEAFLLAFDTETHTAVGAQWTMDGTNEAEGLPLVNTLAGAADGDAIGLVAKGRDGTGTVRGWTYQGGDTWISDRTGEGTLLLADLLALAGSGTEITFTGVVEGCETRLGVDRDEDGFRDRDELDAGSNPADPNSTPNTVGVGDDLAGGFRPVLELARPNPARADTRLAFVLEAPGPVRLALYDVQGRLVRVLVETDTYDAGRSEEHWDLDDDSGRRVGNGIYFAKLSTAEGVFGTRVMVLR